MIELLIALFVFSLLSGVAFLAVKQLASSSEVLRRELTDLGELSRFWLLVERDVREVGAVSSVVEFGMEGGKHYVLGKAVYRLAGGVVYRKAASVGGGVSESILLTDVELFQVICQREGNAPCDINVDGKESTMVRVELKGPAAISTQRIFYVAGANAVENSLAMMEGLSMEVLVGALEGNELKPPTPEEQEIIDVVTGL